MTHTVILEEEADGRFSVHCPELLGCHSCGETEEEAIGALGPVASGDEQHAQRLRRFASAVEASLYTIYLHLDIFHSPGCPNIFHINSL